jgi:hypothetical protein
VAGLAGRVVSQRVLESTHRLRRLTHNCTAGRRS